MEMGTLVAARKTAESAVAEMSEGPLKIAAFETILRKLLDTSSQPERLTERRGSESTSDRSAKSGSASGTTCEFAAEAKEKRAQ